MTSPLEPEGLAAQDPPEPELAHVAPEDRPPRRPWIWGALVLAAGLALSVAVPHIDPHTSGEWEINDWFRDIRNPALNGLAHVIEVLDGPIVTPIILVGLVLVGLTRPNRALWVMVVLMAVLSWLPGHYAKVLIVRERPDNLDAIVVYPDAMSYVSGHTGMAVAYTIGVLWALTMRGKHRGWMVWLGVFFTVLVGLSRVYSSAHYPLDVVGGALLALGTGLLLWSPFTAAYRAIQNRWPRWATPAEDAAERRAHQPGGRMAV